MKKRKGLIILMAGLLLPVCVNAATHMVTNTGDGGAGSLRAAVAASNAEGGMSQIRFDLPGSNPHIRLDSALTLTSSVTLDGSSVSGQLVLSAPASAHLFIFRPASANDSIVLRSFAVDSVAGTQILLDTIHALASASFRQLKMEFASPYSRIYPVDDKWKVRVDSCQFANCIGKDSSAAVLADCHCLNVNGSSFTNCEYGVMNFPFASKYATSFLFSNSSFKNCSTVGICLYSARQNLVRKCTFDSSGSAFYVNYPMDKLSDIIVDSCIIRNATEYGIYSLLNGVSVTVSNCMIDSCGWSSVYLTRNEYRSIPHYPSQIVLYKNQFKNSIKHINVYVGAEKTTVKDNVIVGSSVDWGLFDRGSDTLIVEGNRVGMDSSGAMVPNAKGGIEIRTKSSIMLSTNKLRSEYKVVRNNIFAGNGGNAIQIDSAKAQVIISNNQFIKTGALAISNAQKLSVPVISDLSVDGGYVRVSGKVDSLSMVELYLTDSTRQTARLFVDSVRTDAEGNFSFRVPRALMQQHALYCFAATATYHALNTSNLSDPVCCDLGSGVTSLQSNQVWIYPNPTQGVLSVVGISYGHYEVLDVSGRVLLKGPKGAGMINVGGLPAGTYLLKLYAGNKTITKEIIKQ
jgi:hypothetical protein